MLLSDGELDVDDSTDGDDGDGDEQETNNLPTSLSSSAALLPHLSRALA